jgi:hypothetical protein
MTRHAFSPLAAPLLSTHVAQNIFEWPGHICSGSPAYAHYSSCSSSPKLLTSFTRAQNLKI